MTTIAEIERVVQALRAELGNPEWDAAVPAQRCALDAASMPIPLLHACRRRWGVPSGWTGRSCPICDAAPGFAEVCGVERTRYLRCLRCGAAWQAHGLACVFCGTGEHGALGALVVEGRATIEVCNRCHGYLKVFATLRPAAPEDVLAQDLASVELDIAAGLRGYRRP